MDRHGSSGTVISFAIGREAYRPGPDCAIEVPSSTAPGVIAANGLTVVNYHCDYDVIV